MCDNAGRRWKFLLFTSSLVLVLKDERMVTEFMKGITGRVHSS